MSRELLAQLQRQSGDIPFVEELQEAISESPSAIFSFMPSGWVADGGANRMSPLEGIGLKLSKKPLPEELGYRETQYTLFGKPAAMRGDKREAKLVTKKASGRRRSTESAGDGKQDAEAAAAVIAAGSQITSLGFYNPAKESLPYGFEEIKKGIMGDKYDADVFNSRNDGLRIIVRRSASAFISQVGLTLDNELPNLAPGIAPVRRTIAGTPADVEEGMYLCFRKNPARALSRFRGMPGGADGAVFAACLFSGEPDVVSGMLEALSLLDYDSLPGPVMNELIAAIAEEGVTMAFTTNTEFVDSYLRHLGYLLIKGLGLISVATIVKVLVMCYQLRPFQSAEELQAMLMRRASRTTTLGDLKSFQLASFCEKDVKGGRAAAKTNALVGGLGFAEAKSQGDGSTAAAAKPRKTQSADAKSSRIAAIPEDGSAAIAEEGGETSGSAGAEETKAAAPPKADAAIRSLCARNISRIIQRIEIGRPEPPQFEAKGSLVKAMNAFFREGDLDAEFYTALRGATKGIMGRSEKIFAGLVLTFCKLSGAQADPNSPTTTKRRLFALKALRGCLASQVSADMSPNMKTLIKLFVVQALVNCAAVDAHHSFSPGDPSMCKEVLKCVLLITNSFKDFMAPQIGVLIENLVLPLLSSQYVSVSHKHDVISMLTRTMSSHEAVVNVYYNFDNHYYGRKVFEKTMAAVSKVADADGEKASAEMQSLQRAALQFLVQILGLLAKRADLYEDELAAATANTINPKLLKGTDRKAKRNPLLRRSTWSMRRFQQQEFEDITKKAIRMSKKHGERGIKVCYKYITACNPSFATPLGFADFLFKNYDKLDQKQIGDYLGVTGKTEEKKAFHEELRRHFFRKLDFADTTLVAAMRTLLEEGRFYLPGEGQKIDQILETFSKIYFQQNKGKFRSADAVNVLAYQIIMLNVMLHNKTLQKKKSKVATMTVEQLKRNLRGCAGEENGKKLDFPGNVVENIYAEIKAREFQKKGYQLPKEGEVKQSAQARRRNEFDSIMRNASAELRSMFLTQNTFRSTQSPTIVKGLYEVCWWLVSSTIDHLMKNSSRNVELTHQCLEGIRNGVHIGIRLTQEVERLAFLRILAEIHFVEVEKAKAKSEELDQKASRNRRKKLPLNIRLSKKEHERALWYRKLNMQVKRAQKGQRKALQILNETVDETKMRVSHDKEQDKLQRLQAMFGKDTCLVEPTRTHLLEDNLTKISVKNNKRDAYRFFLFSDLLIYAKAKGSSYKVHQVVHLSLARVVDIRAPRVIKGTPFKYIFRVQSPQKEFLIACADAAQKAKWINGIVAAIEKVMTKRNEYLAANRTDSSDVVSSGSNDNLQVMSSWIASSEMDLFGNGGTRQVSGCKLCIRQFSSFSRRKQICPYCQDAVCSDCRTKKPKQGKVRKAVCDACYGFLNGLVSGKYMVGGRTVDVPVLTVEGAEQKQKQGLVA